MRDDAAPAHDAAADGRAIDASSCSPAGGGTPGYHDLADTASWSTFDTTTADPTAVKFAGAAFDGRYLYLAPYFVPNEGGTVARYDTQATFTAAGSWSTFATTTLAPGAAGFVGAVFDGRYINFVPDNDGNFDGIVARYDTQASFTTAGSWATFDASTVNTLAVGFQGGAFDGRYVYYAPFVDESGLGHSVVTRYDTQAAFATSTSWAVFDQTSIDANAYQFIGAAFDGRYVYFVPVANSAGTTDGIVVRYDTQRGFGIAGSWSKFELTSVDARAKAMRGAVFDGRYLYFVPNGNGVADGVVVRYDTQAAFTAAGSWTAFDATTVSSAARGFLGGVFDGRYVYFVPYSLGASGVVLRYDTEAGFACTSAWTTFDVSSVDPNARGFFGAAFDGQNVYLVPTASSVVARFQARDTSAQVTTSHGSFF